MATAFLLLSAACAVPAWWGSRSVRWWLCPASSAVALALAASAAVAGRVDLVASRPHELLVVAAMLVAVAGGGPLTVAVLRSVSARTDLNEPGQHEADDGHGTRGGDVVAAAEALRGGAWIGALERIAVAATLIAGWPEGLAVVLAVKGLGRYPELRRPGAAERFIIGTFTSVLWAAGAAGVVALT